MYPKVRRVSSTSAGRDPNSPLHKVDGVNNAADSVGLVLAPQDPRSGSSFSTASRERNCLPREGESGQSSVREPRSPDGSTSREPQGAGGSGTRGLVGGVLIRGRGTGLNAKTRGRSRGGKPSPLNGADEEAAAAPPPYVEVPVGATSPPPPSDAAHMINGAVSAQQQPFPMGAPHHQHHHQHHQPFFSGGTDAAGTHLSAGASYAPVGGAPLPPPPEYNQATAVGIISPGGMARVPSLQEPSFPATPRGYANSSSNRSGGGYGVRGGMGELEQEYYDEDGGSPFAGSPLPMQHSQGSTAFYQPMPPVQPFMPQPLPLPLQPPPPASFVPYHNRGDSYSRSFDVSTNLGSSLAGGIGPGPSGRSDRSSIGGVADAATQRTSPHTSTQLSAAAPPVSAQSLGAADGGPPAAPTAATANVISADTRLPTPQQLDVRYKHLFDEFTKVNRSKSKAVAEVEKLQRECNTLAVELAYYKSQCNEDLLAQERERLRACYHADVSMLLSVVDALLARTTATGTGRTGADASERQKTELLKAICAEVAGEKASGSGQTSDPSDADDRHMSAASRTKTDRKDASHSSSLSRRLPPRWMCAALHLRFDREGYEACDDAGADGDAVGANTAASEEVNAIATAAEGELKHFLAALDYGTVAWPTADLASSAGGGEAMPPADVRPCDTVRVVIDVPPTGLHSVLSEKLLRSRNYVANSAIGYASAGGPHGLGGVSATDGSTASSGTGAYIHSHTQSASFSVLPTVPAAPPPPYSSKGNGRAA